MLSKISPTPNLHRCEEQWNVEIVAKEWRRQLSDHTLAWQVWGPEFNSTKLKQRQGECGGQMPFQAPWKTRDAQSELARKISHIREF